MKHKHDPTGKNGYYENLGARYYKKDRRLHRIDGPAVIYQDGEEDYWLEDESYTKEEWENHPLVLQYRREELIYLWKK